METLITNPSDAVFAKAIKWIHKEFGSVYDLPKPVIQVIWVVVYRAMESGAECESKGGESALVRDMLKGGDLTNRIQHYTLSLDFLKNMIQIIRQNKSKKSQLADSEILIDALKWNMFDVSVSWWWRRLARLTAKADPMYQRPVPSEILREPIKSSVQAQVNQIKVISPALKADCDHISQWFLDKLNEGSAASALMIVTTGEESNLHLYGLNTVKEAINMAHADLISKYKHATRYVIAYDAGWYNDAGIEQRGIFLEAEEKISVSSRLLAYRILPASGAPFSFTNEIFEFKPPAWSLYKPQ